MDTATGSLIVDHSTFGLTGALAVHPTNADVLVAGWTLSWWSIDGGRNLTGAIGGLHPDRHGYRFTSRGRLWEASDGGVGLTDDPARDVSTQAGPRWDSTFNRGFASLLFYGPSAANDAWGRISASAGTAQTALVAGGLQDNNNVYAVGRTSGTPWQPIYAAGDPGSWYDGQAVFLPPASDATLLSPISSYGSSAFAHVVPHPGRPVTLEPAEAAIPVLAPGALLVTPHSSLVHAQISLVPFPSHRNAQGALMQAAATKYQSNDLYGLFALDAWRDSAHWALLTTLPVPRGSLFSAVASFSGSTVLVGVRGSAKVFFLDVVTGTVTQRTGLPADSGDTVVVVEIVVISDDQNGITAYAIVNNGNRGEIFRTTGHSGNWTSDSAGLPGTQLLCLAIDRTTSTLFTATQSTVWVKRGAAWSSERDGLPHQANCDDLAVVVHPDGHKYLHLGTWGWSTWVTAI